MWLALAAPAFRNVAGGQVFVGPSKKSVYFHRFICFLNIFKVSFNFGLRRLYSRKLLKIEENAFFF